MDSGVRRSLRGLGLCGDARIPGVAIAQSGGYLDLSDSRPMRTCRDAGAREMVSPRRQVSPTAVLIVRRARSDGLFCLEILADFSFDLRKRLEELGAHQAIAGR